MKSMLIAQVAQAYFEVLASVELQRESDESLAIARRSHALVSQRRLFEGQSVVGATGTKVRCSALRPSRPRPFGNAM